MFRLPDCLVQTFRKQLMGEQPHKKHFVAMELRSSAASTPNPATVTKRQDLSANYAEKLAPTPTTVSV
jgi:uncharacterized protein YciW